MDEVEVTNTGIHQCFERCKCHTLEDSCPNKACIAFRTCTTPGGTNNHDDGPEEEEMSLPPNSGRSNKQEASNSHSQEMVAREKRGISESSYEP